MLRQLLQLLALAAFIVALIFYPYLPGRYDPWATTLSTAAQVLSGVGLLVAPIGLLWLVYELRRRAQPRPAAYRFALAALGVASLFILVASLVVFASVGYSLGLLVLALWGFIVWRLARGLRRLKQAAATGFNPAPLYLVLIPLLTTAAQVGLARPALQLSRSHAIQQSAALIAGIEAYRAQQGRYPISLAAEWPDYYPNVVGIPHYHYAPDDQAYNLVFEQPRLLFDEIGAREFVVFNPLDQHFFPSHAAFILTEPAPNLAASPGWFAVHDTGPPHWKYFLYD